MIKPNLLLYSVKKIVLTCWYQFAVSHTKTFTITECEDFNAKVEYIFEDVEKEIQLFRCFAQLYQIFNIVEYTKIFYTIVLELYIYALDDK